MLKHYACLYEKCAYRSYNYLALVVKIVLCQYLTKN
jgi:hypothetical protein